MKKTVLGLVLAIFAVCAAGAGAFAEEQQSTVFLMGRVERLLYGSERTGGLIDRLNGVEKEMFGRELPGSIAERQNALLNFIEKGRPNSPPSCSSSLWPNGPWARRLIPFHLRSGGWKPWKWISKGLPRLTALSPCVLRGSSGCCCPIP
jgi:hypothetical protein